MNADSDEEPYVTHYFVDEAGDPVLFNGKGQILLGQNGCSNYFILGKLEIENPAGLTRELDTLRADLLNDPYFKRVPSMQPEQRKTALGFHAKDDIAEVRREVFRVLMKHEVRFYAVVRDKRDLVSYVTQRNERESTYRYNHNEQYDTLVKELFSKLHHGMPDTLHTCFAKRGNKPRNAALKAALEQAERLFEQNFGFRRDSTHNIFSSTPPDYVGLQAVDYYLWALQRFYERNEERYIELIWNQVGEVHDLDVVTKKHHKGAFFNKQKPLTSAALGRKEEPGI